ncbi:hypothetical protein HDU83_000825, partial [Entophlyctis luteolus]
MPFESATVAFGQNDADFQPTVEETKFNTDEKADAAAADGELAAIEADRLNHLEDQVDDFGVEMVTKIVSLEDDPTMPVITFRYFLISTLLAAFSGTLGQIYYFKPQVLTISVFFLLLFSYVSVPRFIFTCACLLIPHFLFQRQFIGKFLESVLPRGILNPGKFNKKEHALIVITANTA